jgi:hypothetical protein
MHVTASVGVPGLLWKNISLVLSLPITSPLSAGIESQIIQDTVSFHSIRHVTRDILNQFVTSSAPEISVKRTKSSSDPQIVFR